MFKFGILGFVQAVLLVLKLAAFGPVATWPWWQVMLPSIVWVLLMVCVGIWMSLIGKGRG